VIPIIGARKLAQIEDNLRSLDVTLSQAQLQRLDRATAVSLGFPHDFMALAPVKAILFGGLRDRIRA
jgi:diketogulonate reductase-like aldo/keto reductase